MGNSANYQTLDSDNPDGEYECNLTYLIFPALFRLYLTEAPGLALIARPEIGFLTKAELLQESGSNTVDVKRGLPSVELFLTLGIGLEKKASSRIRILANCYFTMGMFNLRDETRSDSLEFKPQEFT